MKGKIFFISLLFLFIGGFALAQSAECIGPVQLTLSPNPAFPQMSVIATAEGLFNCDNYVIELHKGTWDGDLMGSCVVPLSGSGCDIPFNAPSDPKSYTYYAYPKLIPGWLGSATLKVETLPGEPDVLVGGESGEIKNIAVTRPNINDKSFQIGGTLPIDWRCSNIEKVWIALDDDTNKENGYIEKITKEGLLDNIPANCPNGNYSSWFIPLSVSEGTYYVMVADADTGVNRHSFSAPFTITTASGPVAIRPPDGAKNVALESSLEWVAEVGAVTYNVEIWKKDEGPISFWSADTDPPAPFLENDTVYYWRVKAWNNKGQAVTGWGGPYSFRTVGVPGDDGSSQKKCANEGEGCLNLPCCPDIGLSCLGSPGHEECIRVVAGSGEEPTTGGGVCPEGQVICNPLKHGTFQSLLGAVAKFFRNIGLALAPVMFIIAGFMYVTSAGDPGKVKTAQNIALYTVIGLAVILLASGLVKVLQSIIGV